MGTQSSRKRHRQSRKEYVANRLLQARSRTALKRALKSIADNIDEAKTQAKYFNSFIDRAARKGGVHRRKAARLKSRLAQRIARADKTKR